MNAAAELADGFRKWPVDRSSIKKLPAVMAGLDDIALALWAGRQPPWDVESPHWAHLAGTSKLAGFQIFGLAEQLPNPENQIVLSAERNNLGGRRARVDWRWSKEDGRRFEKSADDMRDVLGDFGVGRLIPRRGRAAMHKINSHHASGTTRMSTDPARGVVDINLRAHDHPNLYIVGSSVFNTAGFANPTLTDVALGLRLGQHLGETASQRSACSPEKTGAVASQGATRESDSRHH